MMSVTTARSKTIPDKLWFVRRLDLFEGLSEAEMARLATLMHDRECRTGEDVVVRPQGDRIYLVKIGRASCRERV